MPYSTAASHTFPALAGTFLETFDDKDLENWQEPVQLNNVPGSWEVVDDELHAVSRETFLRLLTTGDDTWEDYTVEFDVKPLKTTRWTVGRHLRENSLTGVGTTERIPSNPAYPLFLKSNAKTFTYHKSRINLISHIKYVIIYIVVSPH